MFATRRRVDEALAAAQRVESRQDRHEAVCTERWKEASSKWTEIGETIQAMKAFLAKATWGLIAALLAALGAIIMRLMEGKGVL